MKHEQWLTSFNPDRQFAKQRQADLIMNNWYGLPIEEQKKTNPFAEILKEIFDEPPFIPKIDARTAKERRNND